MTEVLTRENSIPNLTSPTGRKFGVRYLPANPNLLEVVYVDNKPGDLPDSLKGLYTKKSLAVSAIERYLHKMWDMSDKSKK